MKNQWRMDGISVPTQQILRREKKKYTIMPLRVVTSVTRIWYQLYMKTSMFLLQDFQSKKRRNYLDGQIEICVYFMSWNKRIMQNQRSESKTGETAC